MKVINYYRKFAEKKWLRVSFRVLPEYNWKSVASRIIDTLEFLHEFRCVRPIFGYL